MRESAQWTLQNERDCEVIWQRDRRNGEHTDRYLETLEGSRTSYKE